MNDNETSLKLPCDLTKRIALTPGKPRGATYDGNVCLVCSDRASGFHYGVLACEGCKGFFKRVCKEKVKNPNEPDPDPSDHSDALNQTANTKRQCVFGGSCEINVHTRNRCQYCRIQKCIELGMSKDGIKLGRRSKKFKQNLKTTVGGASSVLDTSASVGDMHSDLGHHVNKLDGAKLIIRGANDASKSEAEKLSESNNQVNLTNNAGNKPVVAVLQDNKIIFKAIDILTAVAATAQLSQTNTLVDDNNDSVSPVLANNTQILNNSSANDSSQTIQPKVDSNNNNTSMLQHQLPSTSSQQNEAIIFPNTNTPSDNNDNSTTLTNTNIIKEKEAGRLEGNNNFVFLQTNNVVNVNGPIILLNSYNLSELAVNQIKQIPTESENTKLIPSTNTNTFFSMLNQSQLTNLIDAIAQAHLDTYHLKTPGILNHQTILNFSNNLLVRSFFEQGLLHILTQSKFLDYFNNLIESAVLFAKNVPYFMNTHESDRITLLKSCVFEIILVRHAACYSKNSHLDDGSSESSSLESLKDRSNYGSLDTLAAVAAASTATTNFSDEHSDKIMTNLNVLCDYFWMPGCERWTSCEWLCEKIPQLKRFVQLLIEFYQYFAIMKLDNHQLALFCAYLLYDTNNLGLNESNKLSNFRHLFYEILKNELSKKKSIGTESDDIFKWLNSCREKLKELNKEHSQILAYYKQFVQFPDLYAELYNL